MSEDFQHGFNLPGRLFILKISVPLLNRYFRCYHSGAFGHLVGGWGREVVAAHSLSAAPMKFSVFKMHKYFMA